MLQKLPPEIQIRIISSLDLPSFAKLVRTNVYWNTFLDSDFQEIFSGMQNWVLYHTKKISYEFSKLDMIDLYLYLFSTTRLDLIKSFISWFDYDVCSDEWECFEFDSAIQAEQIDNIKFLFQFSAVSSFKDEMMIEYAIMYDSPVVFNEIVKLQQNPSEWLETVIDELPIIFDITNNKSIRILGYLIDSNIYIESYIELCFIFIEMTKPDWMKLILDNPMYEFRGNIIDGIIEHAIMTDQHCAEILVQSPHFELCDKASALEGAIAFNRITIVEMILVFDNDLIDVDMVHHAICHKLYDILDLLIENCEFDHADRIAAVTIAVNHEDNNALTKMVSYWELDDIQWANWELDDE